MTPEHRTTKINPRGRTADIIAEVLNTYHLYIHTSAQFASQFRRDTEIDTARAIFDYIILNIRYREDPPGVQWIKTPARLLADAEGDCKSMAIFTASMLYHLGIPFAFRFVSFTPDNNITHVYIVTRTGIIIDPVERTPDNRPIFNYARPYSYKKDYPMDTTRISRLSGTGTYTDTDTDYMLGTDFTTNTVALNYLLSELDLTTTILTLNPDDNETRRRANITTIAINLYRYATSNPTDPYIIAAVIAQAAADPLIITPDPLSLDTLIRQAIEAIHATQPIDPDTTDNAARWYLDNVAAYDYNTLSPAARLRYTSHLAARQAAVSSTQPTQQEINALLADIRRSSPYYMYALCPDTYIDSIRRRYPQIYKKVRIEQALLRSWTNALSGIVNAQTLHNHLYADFVNRTRRTPQQYVQSVIDGRTDTKVALAPVVIAAIVAGVLTLISQVTVSLIQLAQAKLQSVENYPSGLPDDNDFTLADTSFDSVSTTSSPRPLIIAAAAILALKLLKRK